MAISEVGICLDTVTSTLKTEVAGSSRMLLSSCKPMWHWKYPYGTCRESVNSYTDLLPDVFFLWW